ncbi:hypothetical protein [Pseudomonas lundensis]|uniref:hypothetical protein n=1 Tax=Pseudomonas lundensis TaxID=86185 RepID=UPI0014767C21|nr:hypothetical protein [Pseudomonas lundensis]NNA39297.1 hypothetical protein [Pseudomonas lundensis]
MYTRDDFVQQAEQLVAKYPTLSVLSKVGDPRTKYSIEAIAGMLAMYSSQLEVAVAEVNEKARDSTVMADAAMRGIIPRSTPARLQILARNIGTTDYRVEGARSLLDTSGLSLQVGAPATVPAGGQVTLDAVQIYSKTMSHTVTESRAFYEIEIDMADDDSALCGISVSDGDGEYEHRERYTNTAEGERVFHMEVDERRRVYVRFGQSGVVGVQLLEGAVVTITGYYSAGAASFKYGSPVVFESMVDAYESQIELTIESVTEEGQNPIGIQALRELAKYPSIYNHNAVFLGEFDFLVRRNFPSLQFLSVWNETAEERARGANIKNMNVLFVACLSAAGDEEVLIQPAGTEVAPTVITSLTGAQESIKAKILAADDSYQVRFITAVRAPLGLSVTASVSSSYQESSVKKQIVEALLESYGESAETSKRGQSIPLYQQIYKLLREKVPALAVGRADLMVSIDAGDSSGRPELWRYVSEDRLSVGVVTGNVTSSGWGGGF